MGEIYVITKKSSKGTTSKKALILFLLSAFFSMPLVFWSLLDFLKSSLTKNNYKLYCKKIATTIILIFFVNFIEMNDLYL